MEQELGNVPSVLRIVIGWSKIRRMKLLPPFLLGALFVVAFLLYREHETTIALKNQLAAKKEESQQHSLDLQEKCADQARKEFALSGYKPKDLAGFENHYNQKLNKCFILYQATTPATGSTVFVNKTLNDAFEGKNYAQYAWKSDEHKKYWEVAPFVCQVTTPSSEEKFCHSTEEFEQLVKPYMQD